MPPLIQSWRSFFVPSKKPAWFAAAYVVFSCVWIFLTDELFGNFALSREASIRWSIGKGLVYVSITGSVIYAILRQLRHTNENLEATVAARTAALARSEEEMRGQGEWLRRLLSSLPDVTWTSAQDGRTIFISPNVESIFGFSAEEICERGEEVWLRRIHAHDQERVVAGFQALFSDGRPFDEEYQIQCKDGHWMWVHDRAVRTHKEGGAMFADGIFSDITARKQAEAARQESDRRYQLLFDRGLAGVFRIELGGRILECNPALARMLGYDSASEVLNCTAPDILYDPAEEQKLLEGLTEGGATNNVEVRLKRKDGSAVWGLQNICVVEPSNGGRPYIEGTVVDISGHKHTAETLRRQLSLMQAIMSAAPDGLFVLDAQGLVTYMNPAAEGMFGYRQQEVLGKVLDDVCHSQRRDGRALSKSECPIAQAYEAGKTLRDHEDVNFRKDGTAFEVSCSSAPLLEEGQLAGCVVVVRDITKRKQAEAEYRSLQEQFLHAQKMEALGRFASGVAHDFNNLLQVVNGYADLISEASAGNEQLEKRARSIKQAGDQAARLTQELLDFSRHNENKPLTVSLDRAIKEKMQVLRSLVGADVGVSFRLRGGEACVKISASQLEQVIMNLTVNARDAMPKGGKLEIETAPVDLDEKLSKPLGGIPPGPYVRLSVSDTGCGMDSVTASRVFEPFFTTKEPGKGTGLGLSTVYGIVTRNGGGIQIHSRPGAGTTLNIYLPQVETRVSVQQIKERLDQPQGRESILLVEDENEVRRSHRQSASRPGIYRAGSGQRRGGHAVGEPGGPADRPAHQRHDHAENGRARVVGESPGVVAGHQGGSDVGLHGRSVAAIGWEGP